MLDVTDLGVLGNGLDDDTEAIQEAIDNNNGRSLFFPAGTYLISDQLVIPAASTIVGEGLASTIFAQQTNNKRAFYLEDAPHAELRDFGIHAGPSSEATPTIEVFSNAADILYLRLRNIHVHSLGNNGIGLLLKSSSVKTVSFSSITNLYVCGGDVTAHQNKIGIKVGVAELLHVVRTTLIGGRIWRCKKGVVLDQCDTVMAHGLALDDISDVGLDFNLASACHFGFTAFENGTITKYVNFSENSADNYVNGNLANATLSQLTNNGVRNAWDGSDAAGGLFNRPLPNESRIPRYHIEQWLNLIEGATLGSVNGATLRHGSLQTPQNVVTAAADTPSWNFGGVRNGSGPGGSSVQIGFLFPFAHPATYLAIAQGISNSDSGKRSCRMSIVHEPTAGTFVEHNLVDSRDTIETSTFSFSRSDATVLWSYTCTGGLGSDTTNVTRNLIKLT